jgi:hypothetical protein
MVHGRHIEADMNMKHIAWSLLIILLVIGSVSAVAATDCVDATGIILGVQGINIGIVIGLIVIVIACAYAAGTALGNADYIVLAKDEAYHLGFSILLILGIGGVLLFSCAFMDTFYSGTIMNVAQGATTSCALTDTPDEIATCYTGLMQANAQNLANDYVNGYINQLMQSAFYWNFQMPLVNSYGVTAGAYRRIISNEYDLVLNTFLVPALISISMQKLLLDFINQNVVTWILPIAILLRVFPPTRQMGNIFIAAVVALYLVIPFMYAFNTVMYDLTLNNCGSFAQAVCDNPIDGYVCATDAAATCTDPDGFWNVARLIPQAFFLPNLTIAVAITFLSGVDRALKVVG